VPILAKKKVEDAKAVSLTAKRFYWRFCCYIQVSSLALKSVMEKLEKTMHWLTYKLYHHLCIQKQCDISGIHVL
jgi:hypothetical protein